MATRTAEAGDDGDWGKILLMIGAAGAAGTLYKLVKGQKVGLLDAISAVAFFIGLLGKD